MGFVNLSRLPDPPKTRVINVQNLKGGLNIHEMSWHLRTDQSPDMKNMWWEAGALRARPGVTSYNTGMIVDKDDAVAHDFSDLRGYGFLYHGWYVFCNPHRGVFTAMSGTDRNHWRDLPGADGEVFSVGATDGTFFVHNDVLYYKSVGGYYQITATDQYDAVAGLFRLQAADVTAFIPTTYMNAVPSTELNGQQQFGGGDFYQAYNRMSLWRKILYNCDAETKYVVIPEVPATDSTGVRVEYLQADGSWTEMSTLTRQAYADREVLDFSDGSLTQALEEAGTVGLTNNVRVTYQVENSGYYRIQYDSVMGCNIAEVFGGSSGLCVVLAGFEGQPNAYFWSGNSNVAMDPGYFPMENYNLTGDVSNPITAFGKQQNMLVIFQKRQVGRCTYSTAEVDGRTFITMDYTVISPRIGCDLPNTVQLIENNLVFCNSRHGVMFLKDTSAAYENNIVPISQNVERANYQGGLFFDLIHADPRSVTTVDDSQRYWLFVGEHGWLWDYSLGGAVNDPKTLSWFYWDTIETPACWFAQEDAEHPQYIGRDGYLKELITRPNGEEEADTGDFVLRDETGEWVSRCRNYEKMLTLPSQDFGTFEVLKNVDKVIFEVLPGEYGEITVEYETDYEVRKDPTPIQAGGWRSWVPRNLVLRNLMVFNYAVTTIRRPRCLHIRHFQVRLRNKKLGQELSFVSAQIFYTLRGVDR